MKTKILLLVLAMMSLSSLLFSQKWTVQRSGLSFSANPRLMLTAVNQDVCWGIQTDVYNPKCVLTTDGGEHWSLLSLQGISGLHSLQGVKITAINSDTAWITLNSPSGATTGGIFKTTDGGLNWIKQESAFADAGGHPGPIHFFDANNGLCIGNPRNGYWEVYTTNDGGTKWTRVPLTNIPISNTNDFIFNGEVSGNDYWFTTINNGVYRSTDKGLTWKNAPATSTEIAFKDEMNGLGISYFEVKINKLFVTSNSGESWAQLSSVPVYPSAYFITYVPGTSGTYFITSTSNIGFPESTNPGSAYTTDNGLHWTVVDSLAHGPATFTTGNVGWSAGNGDKIYKWDPKSDIVPVNSTLKKLSTNQFDVTEGPVWYGDSVLLFTSYVSYFNTSRIYSYNSYKKKFRIFRDFIAANGLTCDMDGNLLSTDAHSIVMLNSYGTITKTLASIFNNKGFNNPNDIIADAHGGVYFTDPLYFVTPSQDKEAVYYIDSTGIVTRVIDDLIQPNGVILSPDGTKLYVGDSKTKYVYSWQVAADGSLSNKSVFAELLPVGGITSVPDGMAIDIYGNLYVAGNKSVQIFSSQGIFVALIDVPEVALNCDFGGKDFKTLYITGITNLYSIDLNYPGFAVSRLHAQDPSTDIIPNGSTVKKLSTNQFTYADGPVWYQNSKLLFTDNGNIFSFDPLANQFKLWPNNAKDNFTLTLDKDGNLLESSWKIFMIDKDGKMGKVIADKFNDKPFNNPNDLIADSKGGIYFTDPDYFVTPTQDKTAVYYVDPSGVVKRIIDDLAKPNGVVLSPDGSKLYVGDTENKYLYSCDVAADGSVSAKTTLAELKTTGGDVAIANGMAVDSLGNIYLATELGIQVFTPLGYPITIIKVPEIPVNCDFGGKDFRTLYITAHTNLYSIDLNYPGFAVSRSLTTEVKNTNSNKYLVKIFPNPVQDVLHIDWTGNTGMLEVIDMTGKSVLQKEIQQNNPSMDVSGLNKGIYFVKVRSDKQVFTGKFVKK